MRVPQLKSGGIVQLHRFTRDGLDDLFTAMPRIHTPQARRAIQDLSSIARGIVHASSADNHARVGLELLIGGKWHPQMGEISLMIDALHAPEINPLNVPTKGVSLWRT